MKTKCMSCGGSMKKMQKGGSKDKWGRSSSSDWYGFDPKNKKWTGNKALSSAELKALSHQKRGMGKSYGTYVKKYNSIINDLGHLTSSQQTQLNKYMSKASLPKKIYEGLPNIGTIVGSSAADIPKGSKLKKQKIGGMVKKMAVGGTTTKRIIKKSTGGMYGIPQENLGTSGQYGFAKKGGATKAAKFAALAPPYDKATFADRIAGAKKSVKKKK